MNLTLVIGVAIGLPEPYTSDLSERRSRAGDPQAYLVPPHVTLLPPSQVRGAALPGIEEHLAAVARRHAAFELHLSGPGTFRPVSEVVFVQVAAGLAQCEMIEADVRSGPLFRQAAFPYHPHVTVAHGVPTSALDETYAGLRGYDASFLVAGFTMFEQNADGVWKPRREFTLDGARGG